jgi:hypothetical protein
MEDNRTELQKKFEEQTPTIKGVGRIEYLQTFVSWLHLQVERCEGKKSPIHDVSGSLQDVQEIIEFLQWAFRKVDKGDTPEETVRMLLMNRAKIDNIKFDSNDR